jgi:transcription elongation factor Elf1
MDYLKEKKFIELHVLSNSFFKNQNIKKLKDNSSIIDYNFRCPLCGDSKIDPNKKRAHFFWKNRTKKGFKFHCFNCGKSMDLKSALSLIKDTFKIDLLSLYDSFVQKQLKLINDTHVDFRSKEDETDDNLDKVKIYLHNKNMRHTKLQEVPNVFQYVKDRMIPEIYWNTKVFAWKGTIYDFIKLNPNLKTENKLQYLNTEYMVLPSYGIIDNELMVVGYNFRFLDSRYEPKYIKVDLDITMNVPKFFTNQFDLDIESPYILILEGEVDSLMFKEYPTFAIKNAKLQKINEIKELDKYIKIYVWDNEYFTNPQIKAFMKQLKYEDYAVLWHIDSNNIFKDPNKMITEKYVDNMDSYIKDKIVNGLRRKLLLTKI